MVQQNEVSVCKYKKDFGQVNLKVTSGKLVVVFDIDDTICKDIDRKDIEKIKLLNPEAHIAHWKGEHGIYHYLCLPYLDVLFHYLINHDVRIVFFSAGIDDRNITILEQILSQSLGKDTYQKLKTTGQFEIFSAHHLTQNYNAILGEGRNIKDLEKIIKKGEILDNTILIEDDKSFIKFDQWPCIIALDLLDWNVMSNDGYKTFSKNGAYYLLGIFKEYFEKGHYNTLKLREGIIKIHENRGITDIKKFYTRSESSFTKEMIYIGFNTVKKRYEKATLYGDKFYFTDIDNEDNKEAEHYSIKTKSTSDLTEIQSEIRNYQYEKKDIIKLDEYISKNNDKEAIKLAKVHPELLGKIKYGGSNTPICNAIRKGNYELAYNFAKINPDALIAQCYYEETVLAYSIIYGSNIDATVEMAQLNKESITVRVINILILERAQNAVLELSRLNPKALNENEPYTYNASPIEFAKLQGYLELSELMQKILTAADVE